MIRVVVADDHTLMRDGLKQIIATAGDMEVVGEASDGFQALQQVRQERCSLLLLDMSMPGRNGVELIKQIKAEKPQLPILVLSMHKEDEYAVRAIRAGASGYLCKDSASQQLLTAMRKVAGGGNFISPEFAGDLAFGLLREVEREPHATLSDREFQIFRMLAEGSSGTQIAQKLNLSAKTVSTYKTRIFQKMHLSSVADLVLYAVKHGLLNQSGPD